jgi:trans-4-hydroxy-L-proline dehydratase
MSLPTVKTDRIGRIREWLFTTEGWNVDREIHWKRGMRGHRNDPIGTRYGKAFHYMAERVPVEIGPDELIVGRWIRREPTPEEVEELKNDAGTFEHARGELVNSLISPDAHESIAESRHIAGGMTGHLTPDYPTILKKGLDGIKKDIAIRLKEAESEEERDELRGMTYALTGASTFARRYADEAWHMSLEAEGARQTELLRIHEVCKRVPTKPAQTFREAAQTLWFIHLGIVMELGANGHGCFCPGRVDQYLGPYYERDKELGILTDSAAYEILASLFLKYNEFDPRSVPETLFVGGQTADGEDASNAVSLLCLEVSTDLQMLNPALCVSWHPKLNRDVMRKSVELMGTGIGFPAIFNDEVIVPGLMRDGVTREEAVNYMAGSCVEISAIGCSDPWVASGYVNAGRAFERVVHRLATRERESGLTVKPDDLKEEFKRDLAEALKYNHEITSAHDSGFMEYIRYPLLSTIVNDCVSSAKDITVGGARHNTTMPELVGLANVVDGLMAVGWALDEGAVSLPQLSDILRRDWEGEDALRGLMGSKPPQYGNDDPAPDALWTELSEFWYDEARTYTNPRGGPYQPGYLCWIMHSVLGEKTGATPDGRRAGEALADSVGPVQGHDTEGVTAMLRSSSKMDHSKYIGGIVTNVKFTPSMVQSPEDREKTIDLLETYLHMGGFEVQVNVVSSETLQQAQDHPDQYADLIVRVAGYSDYFTRLSRPLQDEIIRRTEHELA